MIDKSASVEFTIAPARASRPSYRPAMRRPHCIRLLEQPRTRLPGTSPYPGLHSPDPLNLRSEWIARKRKLENAYSFVAPACVPGAYPARIFCSSANWQDRAAGTDWRQLHDGPGRCSVRHTGIGSNRVLSSPCITAPTPGQGHSRAIYQRTRHHGSPSPVAQAG